MGESKNERRKKKETQKLTPMRPLPPLMLTPQPPRHPRKILHHRPIHPFRHPPFLPLLLDLRKPILFRHIPLGQILPNRIRDPLARDIVRDLEVVRFQGGGRVRLGLDAGGEGGEVVRVLRRVRGGGVGGDVARLEGIGGEETGGEGGGVGRGAGGEGEGHFGSGGRGILQR